MGCHLLKKKETIQYIIWGVASAVLNIGLFRILISCNLDYNISNLITIIIVKLFTYITNKFFVFKTSYEGMIPLLKEIGAFILARSATSILDFVGVLFLVEVIHADQFISKCIVAVIVVIANYILSKKFVFQKKE